MLLGKRPRLPIKRTTSMTGIRGDLALADDVELEEPSDHQMINAHHDPTVAHSALVSPRNLRIQSPRQLGQSTTDHFLRTCGLCKRRLATGRDIYMYRGDTAFCSSECREKQIKSDERKEVSGKKKDDRQAAASTAGGRASRKNHTGGR